MVNGYSMVTWLIDVNYGVVDSWLEDSNHYVFTEPAAADHVSTAADLGVAD